MTGVRSWEAAAECGRVCEPVDDFRPVPEGPGPPVAEDQRGGIGPGARLAHEVNAGAGHVTQVVPAGNDLVEYARDAQQPRAVSRREPVDETAQPLRTIGMAPGNNRLAIRGERQLRGPPVTRIGPAFDKPVAFQLRYRPRERRLLDLLRPDQVTQTARPHPRQGVQHRQRREAQPIRGWEPDEHRVEVLDGAGQPLCGTNCIHAGTISTFDLTRRSGPRW